MSADQQIGLNKAVGVTRVTKGASTRLSIAANPVNTWLPITLPL